MMIEFGILAYVIIAACELATICTIARLCRRWGRILLVLAAILACDCLMEYLWHCVRLPPDQWLAASFGIKALVFTTLILALSEDSLGRRIFLALAYDAYSVFYAVAYYAFPGCPLLNLSDMGCCLVGTVPEIVLTLVLIFWILPRMPHDDRVARWREPCIISGMTFAILFTSGIWPLSVVTMPSHHGVVFLVASVIAWVAFPILCHSMRDRQRMAAAERSLALMTNEMEVRRADIEEARRIRHDQRHNRIVICDFLLRGRTKDALKYLDALEMDADRQLDSSYVWCENMTVNAILSGYARKAAAKGIGFTAEAHVERVAPLPDIELVAVVANLVENAINACGEVEGSRLKVEQRTVCVTLRQRGDTFGMTVTNPVPPDFRLSSAGLPCEDPGVGLGSVSRVIGKHAGDWRYVLEKGVLTCELRICGGV